MAESSGSTRTAVKGRYMLLTPDSFVPSYLPGWKGASVVVNISPAGGARFMQLLITLDRDGTGEGNTGPNQYFIYVVEGAGSILLGERRQRLEAGSYVYLPQGTDMQIKSGGVTTRLLVFQKRFEPLSGAKRLDIITGQEREVRGEPFPGSDDAKLQKLLPDTPTFDMAVNIVTCPPGAGLPSVASHIMEHGALMLRGQGIFRLDADWHPVQSGDAIWLSPYCPQWFVAIGKTPASYIYYMDVNRDPM